MASIDPDAPDRDSQDYESYLSSKIAEEEDRLKSLQEKYRVTSMEEQLARLCLQSSELECKFSSPADRSKSAAAVSDSGIAAQMLTAAVHGEPGTPHRLILLS